MLLTNITIHYQVIGKEGNQHLLLSAYYVSKMCPVQSFANSIILFDLHNHLMK